MKPGSFVQTNIEIQRTTTIPMGTRLTITKAFQIDRGRWLLNAVDADGNEYLNIRNDALEQAE